MPAFSSFLMATALIVGTASTVKAAKDRKKAAAALAVQNKKDEDLQRSLASQATGKKALTAGEVDLQSQEAEEEADILARSKRNRLKVSKKTVGGLTGGGGTGLSVG